MAEMEAEQSVLPKYDFVFPICKSPERAPLLRVFQTELHTYNPSFDCVYTSDLKEPEIKILFVSATYLE